MSSLVLAEGENLQDDPDFLSRTRQHSVEVPTQQYRQDLMVVTAAVTVTVKKAVGTLLHLARSFENVNMIVVQCDSISLL